jgi:hypothetical protein
MLEAILATAALVAAAIYAQYRIPAHTSGTAKIALTRLLLIVIGVAFGYVLEQTYADARGLPPVLVFLAGFGLVHLPAAIILFIKRARGTGKS